MEPEDAKDLIEEAIERAEEHHDAEAATERARERQFRDRVSLLVGIFAVLLAITHVIGAGVVRDNIVDTIKASDTYNYMQAKKLRQEILTTAAITAPADQRTKLLAEAAALDKPDAKGHAIPQLQERADRLTEEANRAGAFGEHYEWAETALQMAIVLLSIAMIASSRIVTAAACCLAFGAVALAVATHFNMVG